MQSPVSDNLRMMSVGEVRIAEDSDFALLKVIHQLSLVKVTPD